MNRIIIPGTLIIIILMIGIPTYFNVRKDQKSVILMENVIQTTLHFKIYMIMDI